MERKGIGAFLFVIFSLIVFVDDGFAKKFDDKGFKFFEWDNPTPRFADLGFDLNEVCSIIGDSQMLIHQKGRKIDLWTCSGEPGEGDIKAYDDARFVTSFSVINKPRQEVVDAYMNFDNYQAYMPQFSDIGIIKSEGKNFLVRMNQVYKLVFFSLHADFRYQYTKEDNGDMSVLLLDGDVGAGVARMEFIPVTESKTLVVSTTWLDIASAKFVYRMVIKAQPDIKVTAPVAASAGLTEQFREMLKGEIARPGKDTCLPEEPVTPIVASAEISIETYRRLADMGTLTFVYPKQWIKTGKGIKCMQYITSAAEIPRSIEQSKPLSADFTRFGEYFDQTRKIEIRKQDDGIAIVDWCFEIGLGFLGINVDYSTKSYWPNENTAIFKGTKGDILPLYGAWEWIDLKDNKTLVVFTVAVNISDDASWILKIGNRVPNHQLVAGIFMGTLIVEKQARWIEQQVEDIKSDDLSLALN